jgi:tRNA uridine 5-carboxymethylaminomethyl modification enzyme
VAGANAAGKALEFEGLEALPPSIMGRGSSYLGVLVDDLTRRGTSEPYRMFSSRVEHRLSVRPDNADLRLTAHGEYCGLVDAARGDAARTRAALAERAHDAMKDARMGAARWAKHGVDNAPAGKSGKSVSVAELLAVPNIGFHRVLNALGNAGAGSGTERDKDAVDAVDASNDFHRASSSSNELAAAAAIIKEILEKDPSAVESAFIECYYAPYLERQRREVEVMRTEEGFELPMDLDYDSIKVGLSTEDREKLKEARPATLAAAQRISGVTPAAIISLLRYVKRRDSDGNKAKKGKGEGRGGEEKADDVLMESAMKSLGGSE